MDSESARFRFLISHVGAVKRSVIVGLLLLGGGWQTSRAIDKVEGE